VHCYQFDVDPPPIDTSLVQYLAFVVGAIAVLAFTGSFVFVCWWSACRRQTALHADSKANCPGMRSVFYSSARIRLLYLVRGCSFFRSCNNENACRHDDSAAKYGRNYNGERVGLHVWTCRWLSIQDAAKKYPKIFLQFSLHSLVISKQHFTNIFTHPMRTLSSHYAHIMYYHQSISLWYFESYQNYSNAT